MKKFGFVLGLALIVVIGSWQGYCGFGTAPAHGQLPPGYYETVE